MGDIGGSLTVRYKRREVSISAGGTRQKAIAKALLTELINSFSAREPTQVSQPAPPGQSPAARQELSPNLGRLGLSGSGVRYRTELMPDIGIFALHRRGSTDGHNGAP